VSAGLVVFGFFAEVLDQLPLAVERRLARSERR
jgi:hypothetical protein